MYSRVSAKVLQAYVFNYSRFQDANTDESGENVPVTLTWKNINIETKKGNRKLLKDVSGIAESSQLMALMGASGAGKTTLLNMLMSRNLRGLKFQGDVLVNGCNMGRKISKISGFAQQEELFIGTLTVKEYLSIQARLRVLDGHDRKERVEEVMNILGLTKCQNSRIGVVGVKKGISGGEARRLTFACEMLSNPTLLFADEPTTGLDSFMAEHVVQILSKCAHEGSNARIYIASQLKPGGGSVMRVSKTIVCTIHQPASELYMMFDKVTFLANGQTAFQGTPRESIEFFEKCGKVIPKDFNPAEFIIHQLAITDENPDDCRSEIGHIIDKFLESEYGTTMMKKLAQVQPSVIPTLIQFAPLHQQFYALFLRSLLDVYRNKSIIVSKAISKVILGVFCGLLFWRTEYSGKGPENINGALFLVTGELTFTTIYVIVGSLSIEFPLLEREYHDGLYHVSCYYLARVASYIPHFTVDGILLMAIVYWMIGLNTSWEQVLNCVLICVASGFTGIGAGMGLSCLFPTVISATVMSVPLLNLFRLVSGFYGKTSLMPKPIQFIQYTSLYRNTYEGLVVNQWSHIDSFHPEAAHMTTKEVDKLLAKYSFRRGMVYYNVMYLFFITITFLLIGFIALYVKVRRSR